MAKIKLKTAMFWVIGIVMLVDYIVFRWNLLDKKEVSTSLHRPLLDKEQQNSITSELEEKTGASESVETKHPLESHVSPEREGKSQPTGKIEYTNTKESTDRETEYEEITLDSEGYQDADQEDLETIETKPSNLSPIPTTSVKTSTTQSTTPTANPKDPACGHTIVSRQQECRLYSIYTPSLKSRNVSPKTSGPSCASHTVTTNNGSSITVYGPIMHWMTLKNVCFEGTADIVLFNPDNTTNLLPLRDAFGKEGKHWFTYSWNWKENFYEGGFTQYLEDNENDTTMGVANTWVAGAAWPRHTTHFTDAHMLLFHISQHPEAFPPMEHLLTTHVKKDELEYNVGLLQLLMESLNEAGIYPQLQYVGREKYQRPICYHEVNVLGWLQTMSSIAEAEAFKTFTYQRLNLTKDTIPQVNYTRVFLIQRKAGKRHLVNFEDVRQMIRNMGMSLIENHGQLEYYTFEEQVRFMYEADILIGIHGSGLNNVLFMRPNSVVIEIFPFHFYEGVWSHQTIASGSYYLPMFGMNPCQSREYNGNLDAALRNCTAFTADHSHACFAKHKNSDIIVNLDELQLTLKVAQTYIKSRKYPLIPPNETCQNS